MSITRTPAAGVNSAMRRCMMSPAEYRLNSTSYAGNQWARVSPPRSPKCAAIGTSAAYSTEKRPLKESPRVLNSASIKPVTHDHAKMSNCPVRRYCADFQESRVRKALVSSESATKRSSPVSRSSFRALRSMFLQNCGA